MQKDPETELFQLLTAAEKLSASSSGGYSGEFLSAEAFSEALHSSIQKWRAGDESQLEKIYAWFLPSSCWDDFVGKEGIDIAEQLLVLIARRMKSNL